MRYLSMRNKKRIGAFVLAGTMMFSMGTSVFAADSQVPQIGNNAKVMKHFEMAEGLDVPNVTFHFTAEPKNPNSDAASATITDITYNKNDSKGELNSGKYILSKEAEIQFGEWKHAGVYDYVVRERKEDADGVVYDTSEYTLHVYVKNQPNGTVAVETITAEKENEKQASVLFTNTYKKDTKLVVEKQTVGDYADLTKKFNFEITFVEAGTSKDTTYEGVIKKGNVDTGRKISCKAGEKTAFELADDEKLVFDAIPAGTRYVVNEVGKPDGYTPSVEVIENGEKTVSNKTVAEDQSLNSMNEGKNNLAGEKDNKVVFTNKYKDIAITGIVMNNLPFILLVSIAAVAFVSLAVMRRRRTSEK